MASDAWVCAENSGEKIACGMDDSMAFEMAELRQQLTSLKFSEEKLRRILESITDAIVVTDMEGNIVDVNEETEKRHGHRVEIIGTSAYDMVAPSSRRKAKSVKRLARKGTASRDVEYVLIRKDGSTFSVESTTSPLRDASGNVMGSITVTRDVSQRKFVESELRALSRRLVQIRDDERRAIARELHDQTGQSLTALKIALDMMSSSEPAEFNIILDRAKDVLRELMLQVENLSLDLWPSMLDELGLLSALIWHFDQYTQQTQVDIDFEHANLPADLHTTIKNAAYRIIQESLTNVARHSGATSARVRVWTETNRRKGILHILVEDRGVGFNPANLGAGQSNGFRGMRERALSTGGSLSVESTPGTGTSILAVLPMSVRGGRTGKDVRSDGDYCIGR